MNVGNQDQRRLIIRANWPARPTQDGETVEGEAQEVPEPAELPEPVPVEPDPDLAEIAAGLLK